MTRTAIILLSSALLSSGCVNKATSSSAEILSEPAPDAMLAPRDFAPQVALYANGDTRARSVGFRYDPEPGRNTRQYAVLDSLVFIGNLVTTPITSIQEQGRRSSSMGLAFPPSSTMVPVPTAGINTFEATDAGTSSHMPSGVHEVSPDDVPVVPAPTSTPDPLMPAE